MSIWTKAFWRASAERAISTFAQTFIGLVGADEGADLIGYPDLVTVDWRGVLIASLFAAGLSVLKAVAVSTRRNPGPSATGAETLR